MSDLADRLEGWARQDMRLYDFEVALLREAAKRLRELEGGRDWQYDKAVGWKERCDRAEERLRENEKDAEKGIEALKPYVRLSDASTNQIHLRLALAALRRIAGREPRICPTCKAERADYEGPRAYLTECPNCGSPAEPAHRIAGKDER